MSFHVRRVFEKSFSWKSDGEKYFPECDEDDVVRGNVGQRWKKSSRIGEERVVKSAVREFNLDGYSMEHEYEGNARSICFYYKLCKCRREQDAIALPFLEHFELRIELRGIKKKEDSLFSRSNIPPFPLSFLNSFAIAKKEKKNKRLLRSRRHEIGPDSQAAIDENMRKKNPLVNACLEFNHVRGGSKAHERRSRLHTNCIW